MTFLVHGTLFIVLHSIGGIIALANVTTLVHKLVSDQSLPVATSTIATERNIKDRNIYNSYNQSNTFRLSAKSFESEALTTSPLSEKITQTIQNEFTKLFNSEIPEESSEEHLEQTGTSNSGLIQSPSNNKTGISSKKQVSIKNTPFRYNFQNHGIENVEEQSDYIFEGSSTSERNNHQIETSTQRQQDLFKSFSGSFDYDADARMMMPELTSEECLYAFSEDVVQWRKRNRVLKTVFPHFESAPCAPPVKCHVSTTVNKKSFLQEGDALIVMLQMPTLQEVATTLPYETTSITAGSIDAVLDISKIHGAQASTVPAKKPVIFSPLSFTRESIPLSEHEHQGKEAKKTKNSSKVDENEDQRLMELKTNFVFKRSVSNSDNILTTESSLSPLTIWKVTEIEWTSCSTREGGQVSESDEQGIATIQDTQLPPGTQYFIGRSSWSSSECFKLKVIVRSADCGEGSICSGKGRCYANATMNEFTCGCCHGYAGKHCEERDACSDHPCLNSGICLDIQEGHDGSTFQCLCRYGYGGKHCELKTSLCDSNPCNNGGICEGNYTSFTCRCPIGWAGSTCLEETSYEYSTNDINDDYQTKSAEFLEEIGCREAPCVHGVCIDTSKGNFRCFCQQGFGGERCEMEYNECDSSPCYNGGTCVDKIGSFECLCDRGYMGQLCRTKVDLCTPDPCPADNACVDKGNTYSCECIQGVTTDDCSQGSYDELTSLCVPNPCTHGGTCSTDLDTSTPFCACRPGFTGRTCQGIIETPETGYSDSDNLDQSDVLIKVTSNHNNQNYGDSFVLESVGPVGTSDPAKEVGIDRSTFHNPFARMKNMYTAVLTLTSAFVIFLLVLSCCHCWLNKPYRKCFLLLPGRPQLLPTFNRLHFTSMRDKKRRDRLSSLRFECDPDGASVPMTSQSNIESCTYYNMDSCDNQELPLIK